MARLPKETVQSLVMVKPLSGPHEVDGRDAFGKHGK